MLEQKMAKIKAIDYLTLTPENKKKHQILVLLGDDVLLHSLVINSFLKAWEYDTFSVEKLEIDDGANLLGEWEEGSLMGPRVLQASFGKKLKKPDTLLKLSSENTEDLLIINAGNSIPQKVLERLASLFLEVDCKELTNIKERVKLIKIQAASRKLPLTEEEVKNLSERSKTSVEIEVNLQTLSLLYKAQGRINQKDISSVAGEVNVYRDMTKIILRASGQKLSEELTTGDPLPTLTAALNILSKLYCFLLEKDEEKRKTLAETLGFHKRLIKDLETVRKKHSYLSIRNLHDFLTEIYTDVRSGRDALWKERIYSYVRKNKL